MISEEVTLRNFIRTVVMERFQKGSEVDSLGRVQLTYSGDVTAILGEPQGKDLSLKGGQAVGFPVLSAFVTRPGGSSSPEYVEDVLEALKGKSDTYFISDEDRARFVEEGTEIIASRLTAFISKVQPGYEQVFSSLMGAARRGGFKNIRQVPVIVKTVPSSSGHSQEVASGVINHLKQGGYTVITDPAQLEKISTKEAGRSVKFVPDETAIRRWANAGGTVDGETLEDWASRYGSQGMTQWIRHMELKGKESFSISDIPSAFRRHIQGFIRSNKPMANDMPGIPYVLVIVDDNIESGISMREAARALVDSAKYPPVTTIGATLINLSTSSGNKAPRRGTQLKKGTPKIGS